MTAYLDSSALVALFTPDPFNGRARDFIRSQSPIVIVSDFAEAEFSSAVARLFRMNLFTKADARLVFSNFDGWVARESQRTTAEPIDIAAATTLVRRFELGLRSPDAINIAIAQRQGAAVVTFDNKMRVAAKALGLEIAKV